MSNVDSDRVKVSGDSPPIAALVTLLSSNDGLTRVRARARLVRLGSAATPELVKLLAHPRLQLRWEATKALAQVADPEAAGALVKMLREEDFGVRWLAAEGLVRLGRHGLIPLLEAVSESLVSEAFREGAHHVIHGQLGGNNDETLRPVLEALSGCAARESAPLAAQRALAALDG